MSIKKRTAMISFIAFAFFFFVTVFSLTYGQTNDPTIIYDNDKLSGIIDNVVHVNSLDADYYYYKGLNYTYTSNGTLPTGNHNDIYADNKLVEVQITYSSTDINNATKGYVSPTELQDTFIYYKVFPVNDNGTSGNTSDDYIEIELIENPFTTRPTDRGFNGWVTNYQGTTIRHDSSYYIKYAKVPVTYANGMPEKVTISFNASWTNAVISLVNTSRTWATAFTSLNAAGMSTLSAYTLTDGYYNMAGYFRTILVARNASRVGYYSSTGVLYTSGTCTTQGGCTYYQLIGTEAFVRSNVYYELIGTMTLVNNNNLPIPQIVNYVNGFSATSNMAGFFRQKLVAQNASRVGYYDNLGAMYTSGTCTTGGGCTYYELIQYYDGSSQPELINTSVTYYYLVTRDTNIVVMTTSLSNTWAAAQNKPFTLTSVSNGTDYRSTVLWNTNRAVTAYADTNIENIKMSAATTVNTTAPTSATTTARTMYGNWKNLRIGRGNTLSGTNVTFTTVMGGMNGSTGSSGSPTKYRLIIESGLYSTLAVTNGAVASATDYVSALAIYGSDYDRASGNNTNLSLNWASAGSWGGNIYGATTNSNMFELTVKSGSFGTSKYDYTTGIYVGGRNGGTHYAARQIKVEGGWIYNLIGGPLSASSREDINDSYIYMTGGSIDVIIGGAGTTATYGNRIIQVTGGTVNYSLFGGSNGYQGSGTDGTVLGSSFIYVGGKAIIGNPTLVANNTTIYSAEAGSVFGIGNGRTGYPSIGSSSNSNIIIHDEAVINRNVYGGGNFGATGISSGNTTTSSNLKLYGGTVVGNVYGGGNNNGSGNASIYATIDIDIDGGVVEGNVYGGSNVLGTIFGDVLLNHISGTVEGNIYGGGRGGYTNVSNPGTYVRNNIDVVIGNGTSTPVVLNNVYGGSAFGSVNTINQTVTPSTYHTYVTLNSGSISGAIFGGGKGDVTFSPYMAGDIIVNVNGGSTVDLYGGNDANGLLFKNSTINLNGGTISNVYGGSNQVSANTQSIFLQGSTVTNIYGGSNQLGNVTRANITTTSGTVNTIYGGNNQGGKTTTSVIAINGGNVTNIYGGGKLADTDDSTITVTNSTVTNIYGGGENADILVDTTISLNNSTVTTVYGGSNQSGTVPLSTITITNGNYTSIYGGNNQGGSTTSANITANSGTFGSIYGGGRLAHGSSSHITLNGGTITSVYGGGENANITTDSTITNNGAAITTLYGGSNLSGTVLESNILTTNGSVTTMYGGNNQGGSTTTTNIEVNGGSVTNLFGGGNQANSTTSNVLIKKTSGSNIGTIYGGGNAASVTNTNVTVNGGTISTLYGGSNQSGTLTSSNTIIEYVDFGGGVPSIINLYGGNNQGGSIANTNLEINQANIVNIYGGGNQALVSANTSVIINGSTITGYVFGGGNYGRVNGNATTKVTSAAITNSIYAGGNGSSAVVAGDTTLTIDGTTTIGEHVFGGGNAAETGTASNNNSNGVVTIAGGTINGNVYGGANTSVLYGTAEVNIGYGFPGSLNETDIHILGTVFGGGEANASGSETYDFSFISVTNGIDIDIIGNATRSLTIDGSIFGSGNASSTTGFSSINIEKYGTLANHKRNISIQRANRVTLNNSYIELYGATDRTNEYSSTLFTVSRIKELKLKNNSIIYLETGANLLEKVTSLVDISTVETKAAVTISESGVVTKNVDNRIYIKEGKNLNIATNESVTAYGEVLGMTFFGMYSRDQYGFVDEATYAPNYNVGDEVLPGEFYHFASGSYVLGRHALNHNVTIDGFYSNYENEELEGIITQKYIEPTPEDSTYYMWVIGESVVSYDIELIASKYSTLGTYELPLINFSNPNTMFTILGFNYNGLVPDFDLVRQNEVPRISPDGTADTKMGLVMKGSNTGWLTVGETNFLTNPTNPIYGEKNYQTENSSIVPSLLFYIYHSKNIETAGNIGIVTISMLVVTPIDDLTNDVERININVSLSRVLYTTNNYEGAMTSGEEHDMFVTSTTNITTKSKLSAYYSLYIERDTTLYNTGYYRALVSSFVFPENTKITMIDLFHETPVYYYYIVSAQDVITANTEYGISGEASYPLARFVKMGSTSTNNNYSDAENNLLYYDSDMDLAHEEFVFTVDYAESNINTDVSGKKLLIELRNASNQTIVNVLGIQHSNMTYNMYADTTAVIELNVVPSKTTVYLGEKFDLNVTTNFTQQIIDSRVVHDTTYALQKLGLKITFYDSSNNIVNGIGLRGMTFKFNNVIYYPQMDGSIRINVAPKVANVFSKIEVNTANTNLGTQNYTVRVESFGSPDGIFFGSTTSDTVDKTIDFINSSYGIKVDLVDGSWIIDKTTGKTSLENNALVFDISYSSGLTNPSIRVAMSRRKYDQVYSMTYETVDLLNYVSNALTPVGIAEKKEYLVTDSPLATQNLFLYMKPNLMSGTYKIIFSVYDGTKYIGDVYNYVIIK